MRRPRLYPNHPHQWSDLDPTGFPMPASLVRCTVCGFTAPRNLAGLDGRLLAAYQVAKSRDDGRSSSVDDLTISRFERDLQRTDPDTDVRCTHQGATGQCLDHQGHLGDHQPPQPEQETRT